MRILAKPVKLAELRPLAEKIFGDLVKGVVDIKRELVAIDAGLHVDLAEMLVAQGSQGADLWGFDIFPERTGDDWLEFDSLINIKPLTGNRSRAIENPAVRQQAAAIIKKFIIP
ncbi:MAG: DUF5674 family protein [Patescibacteria group bacterium]